MGYKETPALYSYQYGVDAKEAYGGYVRFGADESRDGYATKGSYNVLLPDGRTQTVTYTVADDYSGYVADVQYTGDYKPDPAPVYHAIKKRAAPAPYQTYEDTPAKYEYKYGVDAHDDYKGYVQFGQNEARDGYSTYGEYRVLLPDGRTQIVSYNTADGYSGNVMDVRYEGKATYAPEPAYKPAPAYKPVPAPAYKPAPYQTYEDTPAKYEYKYGVDAQDGYKGYVQFGQNEARDGYSTYGDYRVLLP